tara:strand:+ start:271 stop:453 length:183 start_codon:yes stop_codon:yes gene_type:complete
MNDFLEIDEKNKTVKSLNLDDFSIEDLDKYIIELDNEMVKVRKEIVKKNKLKDDALKFFK